MKKIASLCFACATVSSVAWGDVMSVDVAPKLDGKLDDACWRKATWEGDFKMLGHKARELGNAARTPIGGGTAFAVLADDRVLSPSGIRFDFPEKRPVEIYEFELPEVR